MLSNEHGPSADAIAQARLLEHDHQFGGWARGILAQTEDEVQP